MAASLTPLGRFSDLLSAGGVVVGKKFLAKEMELTALSNCEVGVSVNGKHVLNGSGSVLPGGCVAEAVTFLANHLNSRGLSLIKGQLVATGQTCILKDIKAGDVVTANFAGLGEVRTCFVD